MGLCAENVPGIVSRPLCLSAEGKGKAAPDKAGEVGRMAPVGTAGHAKSSQYRADE